MTNSGISIAGVAIALADLPDIMIEMRKGQTLFRVTVSVDAAFSSTIIAACRIGASVTISVSGVSYTGIVDGFGCRSGNSIVQVVNATCAH
jgi:hypothetical protein